MIKVSSLKQNPSNPRFIKDERFEKLKKSIQEFPEMMSLRPMVVSNGFVVGGNMRLRAIKDLGMKEIPDDWVQLSDLTAEKEREFIIKDNVGFGEWEWDTLANDWDQDQLLDWGLEIPSFEDSKPREGLTDPDDIPENVEAITKPGDLWILGEHRLLCGDSTNADDVQKLMAGSRADLLLTDPPYNVDYTGKTKDALVIENDSMSDVDFRSFLQSCFALSFGCLKPGASFYIWHADSEGYNFRGSVVDCGEKVRQCLIWAKNSMVMGRQDYHWQHEPCLYGWKEGASHGWYTDRKQTTVLNFDRPNRNAEHPTMKPVALFAYLLANSTAPQGLAYDPFLGSGTTMIAAEQLGRKCYGMEISPQYCDVIVKRWEDFTGKKAELET